MQNTDTALCHTSILMLGCCVNLHSFITLQLALVFPQGLDFIEMKFITCYNIKSKSTLNLAYTCLCISEMQCNQCFSLYVSNNNTRYCNISTTCLIFYTDINQVQITQNKHDFTLQNAKQLYAKLFIQHQPQEQVISQCHQYVSSARRILYQVASS